ncbi:MAG: hypothetical protein K2X69_17340 [Silvanigrellaceae bacterium]|nr:hypothetical protein [Silvanigrellaceae bacterium]
MIKEKKELILRLKEEIKKQEQELKELIFATHKEESLVYPFSKFIGQIYIFDKPQKWSHPRIETFTTVQESNLDYLCFNGLFSGEEIKEIYEEDDFHNPRSFFEKDALYATFVIPEEDYSYVKGQPIPLINVHELLAFKI